MNKELKNLVAGTPKILEQVYTDLAQPGVIAVGKALGIVLELSNSFLLPLKLTNEVFKVYFAKWLNDYKVKLE